MLSYCPTKIVPDIEMIALIEIDRIFQAGN